MLNDVSGKCRAVNFFWSAGITKISLLIKTREDPEIPPMARRFRLALKVQSSNVRTDTDRAAGLMKTRGTYERQNESSLPIYQPLPRE